MNLMKTKVLFVIYTEENTKKKRKLDQSYSTLSGISYMIFISLLVVVTNSGSYIEIAQELHRSGLKNRLWSEGFSKMRYPLVFYVH